MLKQAGVGRSEKPTLLAVIIADQPVALGDIFELSVELEPNVIDAATITMANISGAKTRAIALKSSVEVKCGGDTIFTGEVIGMESTYDHDRPSRLVVRALNRMHRMTRQRASRTYTNCTDDSIVADVCGEAGLTAPKEKTTKITYGHVHRVSQTGLEFLRERAARIDYELNVVGEQVQFRPRDNWITRKLQEVKLSYRDDGAKLLSFRPRLSLTNQVDEVICHGWDPAKKEQIVGKAKAPPPASLSGVPADEPGPGGEKPITEYVDWHGKTQEEADATAKRILQRRMMSYITGEAVADGMAGLKVGETVDIEVPDPRFTGSYYVVGLRYRYVHDPSGIGSPGRDAGFRTYVKVQRDRSA